MPEKAFEEKLQTLNSAIEPLEQLLHAWAGRLPAPLFYHSGKQHYGFRYGNPNVEHFCLLKAVRAVSGLNAVIQLARGGYSQEIFIVLRTLIECTTHMEFAIAENNDVTKQYVKDYFSDYVRNSSADFKRAQVKQGMVHHVLGAELDKLAEQFGYEPERL